MNPSYCEGYSGFSVGRDGHFAVGTAGEVGEIEGNLSDTERLDLTAAADAVGKRLLSAPECESQGSVPGSSDAVDLVNLDAATTRIYQAGFDGTCYRGGRDQALRLHSVLQTLMSKYYPRPFPPE